MKYRREIDGLRAVAVLPVILFHGGVSFLGGGYVGVDIFFVISGYLITTIVFAEIREGRFSILTFYERRARRILPALCCVTLCTIPLALLWMHPGQQQEYARSLVAVFLFVSNIFFWRESDYFATDAEELPMLHTWSLAVEEQYYLFFPLLLMLLWAYFRRSTVWVLLAMTIGSLALCHVMSDLKPQANFYLIPTRAWELFIGSLCAFALTARPNLRSEALSLGGLALIVVAIFVFDDRTPFPSLYALAPTLGAAAIILFAPQGTLVAKLLSMRAFVGVGLVSYSAYLWHQPLFAFARIRSMETPSIALMLGLALLSLILAALSWRFVEQPFRKRSTDPRGRRRTLTVAAAVSVAFIAFGVAGAGSGGLFRGAFTDADLVARIEEQAQPTGGLQPACEPDEFDGPDCRTGEAPVIAIWGDSFAAHLVDGVIASAPELPIVQTTMPRCGPFLDAAPYSVDLGREWSESCIAFNAKVLDYLRHQDSVKYVVLSSPFRAYVSKDWQVLTPDGIVPANPELALDMMRRTLAAIEEAGKQAVIVSPTPQTGDNIGRCLTRSTWLGQDPSSCDFALSDVAEITRTTDGFLQELTKTYPVIWLKEGMCPDGICRAMADGHFVYFDHGHLTREGSRDLGRRMGWGTMIQSTPVN